MCDWRRRWRRVGRRILKVAVAGILKVRRGVRGSESEGRLWSSYRNVRSGGRGGGGEEGGMKLNITKMRM